MASRRQTGKIITRRRRQAGARQVKKTRGGRGKQGTDRSKQYEGSGGKQAADRLQAVEACLVYPTTATIRSPIDRRLIRLLLAVD